MDRGVAPRVPDAIPHLARKVRDLGGRALLVGGGVRDHLMGKPVKDWDVEVFGVQADDLVRVLKRIGKVNAVGKSFGVYKLRPRDADPQADEAEIDVSIPRRDSKVGPGHRGIAVEGDPDMPIEEAARRRDLTINAILLDVLTGELLDPYHGQRDLEDGVLRAVDATTFLEDPLRALRVAQFAARLRFLPDAELLSLCRAASLEELPAERIQGEWGKLLLKGVQPSLGLRVAREADILRRVLPEAADADAADLDDALDHLATRRDELEPEGRRWALMLAGWLRYASPAAVEATLDRLWLHRYKGYAVRDKVLAAVSHMGAPLGTDRDLRRLSTVAEPAIVCRVRWAFGRDAACLEALDRAAALGVAEAPPEPLLKGRHLRSLGVTPGPEMGEVLRQVYELQLDGVVSTEDEARDAARSLVEP